MSTLYLRYLDDSLIFNVARPRGALLALRNAASFYEGGKVVRVAGPGMYQFSPLYILPYAG